MRRTIAGLIAGTAIVIASMFGAAPASAATLPAGQQINTVEVFSAQMFKVSPTDASRTTVGAGTGVQRVVGMDVDDSGKGWAIQNNVPDDGADSCVLFKADAVAGTLLDGLTLSIGDDDNLVCGGLDLTGGVLRIVTFTDFDSGNPTVHFGTVDPAHCGGHAAAVIPRRRGVHGDRGQPDRRHLVGVLAQRRRRTPRISSTSPTRSSRSRRGTRSPSPRALTSTAAVSCGSPRPAGSTPRSRSSPS